MAHGSSRGGRGPERKASRGRGAEERSSADRGNEPEVSPERIVAGTIRSPRQELETAAIAMEYWTTAAMEEAEPYPIPEVPPETSEGLSRALGLAAGGLEGLVQGEPPESEGAAEEPIPTATTGGYDYPGPYTRFEVLEALYSVYPYITVGKVFFRQNGTNYVGSAASIGNYAVWTAGHIVHAGDGKESGWSTDMVFVPAYRDGNAPLGKWAASFSRTTTDWYQKGNPNGLNADIAGMVLFTQNGKKISQMVGKLGFAWNRGRLQHWNAMGYPQASPFTGQRMHDCQASYAYDGTVQGVPPVAIGCDMTGGCSGGPWILRFMTDNALNGNNSYRQSNRPEEMNSPYFDDRAKSMWDILQAATP